MGWDYTQGATRGDIVKELTTSTERCKTIAFQVCGAVLWTVQEARRLNHDWQPYGEPVRFIGCYLLEGSIKRTAGCSAGYKAMEEEMGPYYYTCPLHFLDLVPEPDSDIAREWRRKVREWHQEKRQPLIRQIFKDTAAV